MNLFRNPRREPFFPNPSGSELLRMPRAAGHAFTGFSRKKGLLPDCRLSRFPAGLYEKLRHPFSHLTAVCCIVPEPESVNPKKKASTWPAPKRLYLVLPPCTVTLFWCILPDSPTYGLLYGRAGTNLFVIRICLNCPMPIIYGTLWNGV